MAYTPPVINDNDVATPVSAAATLALHQDTYDQAYADAVADAPGGTGVSWTDVTELADPVLPGSGHEVTNVAAMNTLIAGINAGAYKAIYFPRGTYDFEGPTDAIVQSHVSIFGDGMGVTILRQSNTGGNTGGQFFRFGSVTGSQIGRVTVRDLSLYCMNTPASNQYAIYLTQTHNWNIMNIYVNGLAGVLRVGQDDTDLVSSHSGYLNNVVGSMADVGGNFFLLRRAASSIIQNVELHATGGPSSPGTSQGCPMLIQSYSGDVGEVAGVEALRVTNCALWSPKKDYSLTGTLSSGGTSITSLTTTNLNANMLVTGTGIQAGTYVGVVSGSSVTLNKTTEVGVSGPQNLVFRGGQPRCVHIDTTHGDVANVWFSDCDFDAASTACIDIAPTGGDYPCRQIKFTNCYLGLGNDGNAVRVFNQGTSNVDNVTFYNCLMGSRPKAVARVDLGTGGVKNMRFESCQIIDKDDDVNKNAALSFSESSFRVHNCEFGGVDGNGDAVDPNFDYAIETLQDVSDFNVTGNVAIGMNVGFFNHFDYSSGLHTSLGRIVQNNFPGDAPTITHTEIIAAGGVLRIPPHAPFVNITGATTISEIEGPANRPIVLKFTGICTVAGTNIHLLTSGSNSFTSGANDTLTIISGTGAVWWEAARALNT